MKIQIKQHIHEKLADLARANNITITDLANELLTRMLNHHKNELPEIIRKVKNKK